MQKHIRQFLWKSCLFVVLPGLLFLLWGMQYLPLHPAKTQSRAAGAAQPHLVEWSWGAHNNPSYIASHIDFIESRPFDGIILYDFIGTNLLNLNDPSVTPHEGPDGAVTYQSSSNSLSPLTPTTFKKFTQNFSLVYMGLHNNPPELFDDTGWNAIYASAQNYAQALKDRGLRGVVLDDEIYTYNYWQYPDQVAHKDKTLQEYADKSRQRGRELMQAFVAGYNNIAVIVTHGPYEGCSSARTPVGAYADNSFLIGDFAAGVVEGTGSSSLAVDGGEVYDYRTAQDFANSYQWRKYSITDPANACPFMDSTLASNWSSQISISFGVYDKERSSSTSDDWHPITNTDEVRTTLSNALQQAHDYVWHYSEARDWWCAPGDCSDAIPGVTQDWIDAVTQARSS